MKIIDNRKRAKITGKGKLPPFLALERRMIESREWAALPARALKLLIEIGAQLRGHNNGDLSIPWSKMKRRGFRSPETLNRARRDLIDAGFIVQTRHGGLHQCSLYAVTWQPVHECNGKLEVAAERFPSHAWRKSQALYENRTDKLTTNTKTVPIAA